MLSSWKVKVGKLIKVSCFASCFHSFHVFLRNLRSKSLVLDVLSQTNVLCSDVPC